MSTLMLEKESQSGYALGPEFVRRAVLEIGDSMQGLRHTVLPESLAVAAVREAIDPCLDLLGREIGFDSPEPWAAASRYFHDRFDGLIDTSPIAARCYRKPLGYAGDFEMMNMIYRNQSVGETLFGRSLSRIILDSEAGQAVRNRLHYLARKIRAAAARPESGQPVRILSVAAGPAMELQHLLRNDPALLRTGRVEITLLDQDASALGHARAQIEAQAVLAGVEVMLRCLKTPIRTVIAEGLCDSYDLIYSAGLFDYLKNRTARAAGVQLTAALAPGGRAVIGNFGPANPTRPFMELLLDWPLLHRTVGDLHHLFRDLGTGLTVEQEETGVNLFAVISA